ncbi:MAG: hypothetical protein ACREJQ_06450 [bacterium]
MEGITLTAVSVAGKGVTVRSIGGSAVVDGGLGLLLLNEPVTLAATAPATSAAPTITAAFSRAAAFTSNAGAAMTRGIARARPWAYIV